MESLRQYIFSLVCGTVICAIVPEFFENGSGHKKLVRFVAAILLTIVALRPFTGKNGLQFDVLSISPGEEAQYTVAMGQEQADSMLRQIITQRTQAYILDKAASMGADLAVQVILADSDPLVPETVLLTGPVSPYVKKQLTSSLVSDLAISEDDLQWN